ncbi:MAG: ribonuclease H family protein [Muribaculaceae bacterium]|nr:ribonuclease H family protein [Muribaculaceae bacterium]
MAQKNKYYVVWQGRCPGIYDDWEDCLEQVNGFPDAKYKSFKSKEAAVAAFRGTGEEEEEILTRIALKNLEMEDGRRDYTQIPEINLSAIAVDGACSGNPGMMEYRGVRVIDGQEIFHVGPLPDGTNNVAEYLALIHALALLFRNNDSTTPIYTDSATAVAWVRNRGCRTQLAPTQQNQKIFEMLARANVWIRSHSPMNPILRWNTPMWGEIPADFGRK